MFVIGMGVFVTPFLGIPEDWRNIFLFLLGAGVVLGALACRLSARRSERYEGEMLHEEHGPAWEGGTTVVSAEETSRFDG